jgi:hypothetical protein
MIRQSKSGDYIYPNETLLPGDVFIVLGSTKISRLIATITSIGRESYNHVGMVVRDAKGKTMIIEALKDGVVLTKPTDFFKGVKRWVHLRCTYTIDRTLLNAKALEYVGMKYAMRQIFRDLRAIIRYNLFGKRRGSYKDDMDGVTCSELIGVIYYVAFRYRVLQDINTAYLFPNDYLLSPLFREIDSSHPRKNKKVLDKRS